jgi:hypothetical protein
MGNWRSGGLHVGLIVEVKEPDSGRRGLDWFNGRLRKGDLLLVTQHSGDCFWDYRLIQSSGPDKVRLIDSERISGYILGEPHEKQPTIREFHLLMAGESSELSARHETSKP